MPCTERTNFMAYCTAPNATTATAMLVWPNLVLSNASFYVLFSARKRFCFHCSQPANHCGVLLSGVKQRAIFILSSGGVLPKIWAKASRLAWAFESKTCAIATEAKHVFAVAAQLMRVQKAVHGAVPVFFNGNALCVRCSSCCSWTHPHHIDHAGFSMILCQ